MRLLPGAARIKGSGAEAEPSHATEVPKSLGSLKWIARRILKDDRTGSFESSTEISPCLSIKHTFSGVNTISHALISLFNYCYSTRVQSHFDHSREIETSIPAVTHESIAND